MDDHFWPALYPAIAVGVLIGLAQGSILPTILGSIGGLAGAAAAYFVFTWLGLEESIVSLAGLIGGAVAGACLLIYVGDRLGLGRARAVK